MRKLLFVVIILPIQLLAQGPGGVTASLVWWLQADAGVLKSGFTPAANGQAVRRWTDQSGTTDANQITVANQPIFQTNVVNGYPILRFSGDQFMDAGSPPSITGSFIAFLVFKQSSFVAGGTGNGAGTYIIDRTSATTPIASFKIVTPNVYCLQARDGASVFSTPTSVLPANTSTFVMLDYYRTTGTGYGLFINGANNTTSADNGALTAPTIRLGRHATNVGGGLNGDFAEIAVYNATLIAVDIQKVESYLAIKYGLTLDQTAAKDYIASDGSIIYPVTAASHSNYKFDVAGIGLDGNATFSQSSSQSINAGSMVQMSNPLTPFDLRFLVWGSDNGTVTTPNSSDVPPGILRRLTRVWRMYKTTAGNIGTVDVSIDLSTVPGTKNQADLRLIIDRSVPSAPSFATSIVAPLTGTLVGSIFTVTGVNFTSGDKFTIGTTSLSTPLPIQLTNFVVENKNNAVHAQWITETEVNNDFFALERSRDGKEFEVVTKVKGAGNSQKRLEYFTVDNNPYAGISYYRLKQTDYDGTSTFSKVRSVNVELTEASHLIVYPNPTNGEEFTVQFRSATQGEALVEIFFLTGQRSFAKLQNDLKTGTNTWSIKPAVSLSPGLYVARVNVGGKTFVTKFAVK